VVDNQRLKRGGAQVLEFQRLTKVAALPQMQKLVKKKSKKYKNNFCKIIKKPLQSFSNLLISLHENDKRIARHNPKTP